MQIKDMQREEGDVLTGLIFFVLVFFYSFFLPPRWQDNLYRPALIVAIAAGLGVALLTIFYVAKNSNPELRRETSEES